jgi:hypothetical protein
MSDAAARTPSASPSRKRDRELEQEDQQPPAKKVSEKPINEDAVIAALMAKGVLSSEKTKPSVAQLKQFCDIVGLERSGVNKRLDLITMIDTALREGLVDLEAVVEEEEEEEEEEEDEEEDEGEEGSDYEEED